MGALDRLVATLEEHRGGLLVDLVFALAWVTAVNALFSVLEGPQWAYYLCMLSGIVAYFGFFASLDLAREE